MVAGSSVSCSMAGPMLAATFSFTARCIELAEEGEGLVFGHAGGEFGERLGGEANGFYFVALGFEFGFGFVEDGEGFG